ncbi:MAG: hypothetical protein KDK23_02550 [Leptospiraceae bacterium]|nr:hypothetical protein [Leptospiraceae bacterium]
MKQLHSVTNSASPIQSRHLGSRALIPAVSRARTLAYSAYRGRHLLVLLCLAFACSISSISAVPIYTYHEAAPGPATLKSLETAHRTIQQETGQNICFVFGIYNYEIQEEYLQLDNGQCDGFLFFVENRMDYHGRDFDYEGIGLGYDSFDDAWPTHYSLASLQFERGPPPDNLRGRMALAFADRFIQKENHAAIYWIRDLWEEATEDYILQVAIAYAMAMVLGLIPVLVYLFYRFLTRGLSISWRIHFLLAVVIPLMLLFAVIGIMSWMDAKSNYPIFFPLLLGMAYAFCGFVATFLLGQRIMGVSDWPPYWGILLIYILAPLAVLAAGAAKGAAGSLASGNSGSGGGSRGSGGGIKPGGGTFGGGGASGGW